VEDAAGDMQMQRVVQTGKEVTYDFAALSSRATAAPTHRHTSQLPGRALNKPEHHRISRGRRGEQLKKWRGRPSSRPRRLPRCSAPAASLPRRPSRLRRGGTCTCAPELGEIFADTS